MYLLLLKVNDALPKDQGLIDLLLLDLLLLLLMLDLGQDNLVFQPLHIHLQFQVHFLSVTVIDLLDLDLGVEYVDLILEL